jgi:hypothetical protein
VGDELERICESSGRGHGGSLSGFGVGISA